MKMSEINVDHLASRLEPILTGILKEGGLFVEQLGTEFSKKASGGLVSTAISAVQSLGKAIWKTIGSSRAHTRFRRRWDAASAQSERQQAIRQLLTEDPKRVKYLHDLLLRLDFLRAVAEHAEQLPNINLRQVMRRLSDVYVPLGIEAVAEGPPGSSKVKDVTKTEQVIDRLFDARDMVLEYGDRQALKLIFDTGYDEKLDPNDRLQAIEVMEELGYRDIPLGLLHGILAYPQIDDYWAGDLLVRFGNKAEALEYFRKAITSCPRGYRDQIARGLADLQAIALLEDLNRVVSTETGA